MNNAALNILIVEDESIIAEDLKICLNDLGYNVIGIAKSFNTGLELFKSLQPDFVMLDIMIGGEKDGIDLAKAFTDIRDIPFVFLSSHSDKATVARAKEVHPSAYLLKPFEEQDIYTTIEVAMANFNDGDQQSEESKNIVPRDSLFVKEKHIYVKIPIKEIAYIKSDGNYLHIYGDAFHHMVRHTQKEILDILPGQFMKVHRSFIANASLIKAIMPDSVKILDETVPVSKDYRDGLLSRVTIM